MASDGLSPEHRAVLHSIVVHLAKTALSIAMLLAHIEDQEEADEILAARAMTIAFMNEKESMKEAIRALITSEPMQDVSSEVKSSMMAYVPVFDAAAAEHIDERTVLRAAIQEEVKTLEALGNEDDEEDDEIADLDADTLAAKLKETEEEFQSYVPENDLECKIYEDIRSRLNALLPS